MVISVEQDYIDEPVTFLVKVRFTLKLPGSDAEDVKADPLTCSEADINWVLELPAIEGLESGKVQVSLSEEQEYANLFTITEDHLLLLEKTSMQDFVDGVLCKDSESFDLELVLKSQG